MCVCARVNACRRVHIRTCLVWAKERLTPNYPCVSVLRTNKSRMWAPPPLPDVIFFIYLYQKWIYPVDPNRRNEYEGGDAAGGKEDPATDEEDEGVADSPAHDEVWVCVSVWVGV